MEKYVLLVEDDNFIATAFFDSMERSGLNVKRAKDGVEAMEMIKEEKPAVMLLDIIMPNKNGFEVIEEVKNTEELKDIPIVVISNLGQKIDQDKAKNLGVDEYFIKADAKISEVIASVGKYMGNDEEK